VCGSVFWICTGAVAASVWRRTSHRTALCRIVYVDNDRCKSGCAHTFSL
jgi:hypothetical protein